MFRSISWSDYFNFLWISLLIYYSAIGLLFYRKQLSAVIKRGSDVAAMAALPLAEQSQDQLLGQLREVHRATGRREIPNEELVLTILQIVNQYRGINKELVNQFVAEAFPQLGQQDRRRIGQFIS